MINIIKAKKKKMCLFLAAVILLFCLILAACGDKKDSGNNNNDKPADAQNPDSADIYNGEEETTTEKLLPDVPDNKDFGGYEFVILGNGKDYNPYWWSKDIYVEEETGDLINDAIYYRNRTVEEKFNIKIKGAYKGNMYSEANKSIKSGDNSYDMFTIALQDHTSKLAQDGMLLDLKNVPYIDLEKPWWDQKANQQLSINNKLMFTIGDLLFIDKDALFIFLFNKDVLQEQSLEDPYQLVREGKWTIDKMWSMAKGIAKDINGDGKMDDQDVYGFLSAWHTIHGNVVGSGHFVITKDANDLPELNITDPMIQASYEKWLAINTDGANTMMVQDYDSKYADVWMYQLEVLNEKRALWLYAGMDRVTTLRNFDCNFGILPNPKFDESQSEYYNHVHAWCTTAISIPTTSEPERTGMILEALTAESYYTVRPAYYDVSLKNKFMRDDESGEMLDLIFKTRCYDLGHVYNWGGIFDMFSGLPKQKNNDFVSAYEKILPKVETAMQKAIDNFLEQ